MPYYHHDHNDPDDGCVRRYSKRVSVPLVHSVYADAVGHDPDDEENKKSKIGELPLPLLLPILHDRPAYYAEWQRNKSAQKEDIAFRKPLGAKSSSE